MTKYLISGYIGFDNFGDEAIASVLVSNLKKNGAEKITVLSSNPEKTARLYDVNSEHFLKFFKPILETDVLISGGGSLLQDITSLKSLLYYLAIILFAQAMNKRVIIFAQGFTPFRTKIGEFFTKFVLKRCSKISSPSHSLTYSQILILCLRQYWEISVKLFKEYTSLGVSLSSFSKRILPPPTL